MDLAKLQCDTGYDIHTEPLYTTYLYNKGYKPRINKEQCNIKEFIEAYPTGTYILNIDGHLTVLKNSKIFDTWDCYRYRNSKSCILRFFEINAEA